MKEKKSQVLPMVNQKGFSLIEILVAMSLVAIMFMVFPFGTQNNDRNKLEITLDNFDRAIRFATNESILRNSIIRIKIDFNQTPSSFVVESGPSGNFVLPRLEEIDKLSSKEKEALLKTTKNIDLQFQPIPDLDPRILNLDEVVAIIGAASASRKIIQRENNFSIYFYPTGEKDESLIFFATFDEVAVLEVPGFEPQTHAHFIPIEENEKINLDQTYENKMREFYNQWIR
jgi:prepilin-type N-terminal cleavage/methylation domain-containing protein